MGQETRGQIVMSFAILFMAVPNVSRLGQQALSLEGRRITPKRATRGFDLVACAAGARLNSSLLLS
jgi:hypothetical protein